MDFRILGPLEVWDGARRVQVRGRLHPKVLAGLLLNNGRTVTLEWLVDLLWDHNPPATARRQAQNAVAALRRQLGPAHKDLIKRVSGGYRLGLPDEEVDLRRFEADTRRARSLAETDRKVEALDAFDTALELWRGPALAGLTGRVLEAAAARLDDARLSTIEDRAEVAVLLGRSDEVVSDLRELVEQKPLRQRLTARLMMALDHQGQRPEALQHFERLRNRLAEALGIDPGPELAELHSRILRENFGSRKRPLIPPSTAAPQKPTQVTPAQLPADIATFTGRSEHLATLDRLLDTGSHVGIVSALTGIGGVGKTALAVHWGHMRKESFPDGQLYVNLRGFDEHEPLSPYEAVVRILRVLERSAANVPSTLDEASARYRSVVSERRMLILLDNARSAEQVRPLLPGGTGCLVLVTSRNRLSGLIALESAYPVELDTLSPVESVNLLINIIGPDALRDETSTRTIADSCAHLPLALRIAAARLMQDPHKSIAELADELNTASRLRFLRLGEDPYANVATVFEHSHAALEADARAVFPYLALIPGNDFSSGLAEAVSQIPEPQLNRALESLVQAQLLEQRPSQRFGFHDLIRLYGRELAVHHLTPQVRAEVADHVIAWYSNSKNVTADEFDNLVAVCRALADHPRLWELADRFSEFANNGNDLGTSRDCVLAMMNSTNMDASAEARVHLLLSLGSIEWAAGHHSSAVTSVERARAMIPQLTDRDLEGKVIGNLGNALFSSGRYDEAEGLLQQAMVIAVETGNRSHQHSRVHNLGGTYRSMGRYQEAETQFLHARAIAVENSLRDRLAGTLASLGLLYSCMGRIDDAYEAAREAYAIAADLSMNRPKIMALKVLSDASRSAGRYDTAESQLREAETLALAEQRLGELVEVRCRQAKLRLATGDYSEAVSLLDSTRITTASLSKAKFEGEVNQILCTIHNALSNFSEASSLGMKAVAAFRGRDCDPLLLGRSLDDLGDAHRGLAGFGPALECWTEALEIFHRLGVPEADAVEAKLQALVR